MDNASKALIMAGAILISVAIVGIGIYIFTTANALTDDAVGQIDSLAVSAVNARIETYEGENIRGSAVKQLVREVNTLNAQSAFPSSVTMSGTQISGSSNAYTTTAKDNGRYTVKLTYGANGYISNVEVN